MTIFQQVYTIFTAYSNESVLVQSRQCIQYWIIEQCILYQNINLCWSTRKDIESVLQKNWRGLVLFLQQTMLIVWSFFKQNGLNSASC